MKPIVTTSWDDGSIFDLKVAELLNKYGIKGTFYVPKSLFAHPLERDDILMLDKYSEIGSHTLNHVDLTKVSLSEAKREIEGSKTYLEDLLGHNVPMFCYPSGRFNKDIKKIVRDAGFIAARTTKRGGFNLPSDPYEWQITLYASPGLPTPTLIPWLKRRIAITGLLDWETQAKLLFDKFLKVGGIYHIWGHSLGFEINLHWDKLDRVLAYISHREGVHYMTNGEIFTSHYREGKHI